MFSQGLGHSGFNFEVPPESFIAEEDIVPDDDEDDPDYVEPMIVSVQLSDREKLRVCPRASATPKMPVGIEGRSMGERSLGPMIVAIELGNRNMVAQPTNQVLNSTSAAADGGENAIDSRVRRETQLPIEPVAVIKSTSLEERSARQEVTEVSTLSRRIADLATSQAASAPAQVTVVTGGNGGGEEAHAVVADVSINGRRDATVGSVAEQGAEDSSAVAVSNEPALMEPTPTQATQIKTSQAITDKDESADVTKEIHVQLPVATPAVSMATEPQAVNETPPVISAEISTQNETKIDSGVHVPESEPQQEGVPERVEKVLPKPEEVTPVITTTESDESNVASVKDTNVPQESEEPKLDVHVLEDEKITEGQEPCPTVPSVDTSLPSAMSGVSEQGNEGLPAVEEEKEGEDKLSGEGGESEEGESRLTGEEQVPQPPAILEAEVSDSTLQKEDEEGGEMEVASGQEAETPPQEAEHHRQPQQDVTSSGRPDQASTSDEQMDTEPLSNQPEESNWVGGAPSITLQDDQGFPEPTLEEKPVAEVEQQATSVDMDETVTPPETSEEVPRMESDFDHLPPPIPRSERSPSVEAQPPSEIRFEVESDSQGPRDASSDILSESETASTGEIFVAPKMSHEVEDSVASPMSSSIASQERPDEAVEVEEERLDQPAEAEEERPDEPVQEKSPAEVEEDRLDEPAEAEEEKQVELGEVEEERPDEPAEAEEERPGEPAEAAEERPGEPTKVEEEGEGLSEPAKAEEESMSEPAEIEEERPGEPIEEERLDIPAEIREEKPDELVEEEKPAEVEERPDEAAEIEEDKPVEEERPDEAGEEGMRSIGEEVPLVSGDFTQEQGDEASSIVTSMPSQQSGGAAVSEDVPVVSESLLEDEEMNYEPSQVEAAAGGGEDAPLISEGPINDEEASYEPTLEEAAASGEDVPLVIEGPVRNEEEPEAAGGGEDVPLVSTGLTDEEMSCERFQEEAAASAEDAPLVSEGPVNNEEEPSQEEAAAENEDVPPISTGHTQDEEQPLQAEVAVSSGEVPLVSAELTQDEEPPSQEGAVVDGGDVPLVSQEEAAVHSEYEDVPAVSGGLAQDEEEPSQEEAAVDNEDAPVVSAGHTPDEEEEPAQEEETAIDRGGAPTVSPDLSRAEEISHEHAVEGTDVGGEDVPIISSVPSQDEDVSSAPSSREDTVATDGGGDVPSVSPEPSPEEKEEVSSEHQQEERAVSDLNTETPVDSEVGSTTSQQEGAAVEGENPLITSEDTHKEEDMMVDTTVQEEDIDKIEPTNPDLESPDKPMTTPDKLVEQDEETGLTSDVDDIISNPNPGTVTGEGEGEGSRERESSLLDSGPVEADVLLYAEEDDLSVFSAEAAEADKAFTSSHSSAKTGTTTTGKERKRRLQQQTKLHPSPPPPSFAADNPSSSSSDRPPSSHKSSSSAHTFSEKGVDDLETPPAVTGDVDASLGRRGSSSAIAEASSSIVGDKRQRLEKNEVGNAIQRGWGEGGKQSLS